MSQCSTPTLFGLTGGIASGKSTVADYLQSLGAHVIDADIIARQVVEPNTTTTKEIFNLLGAEFFLVDGHINRPAVKKLIFNDDAIKQQYEEIVLPAIRKAILDEIVAIPPHVCYSLLVAPLLFEKGLDCYTCYNISVDLPIESQIQRAIARNPRDKGVIDNIIKAQMPREIRNAKADFVINNNQPLEDLYQDLAELHTKFCQLPSKRTPVNDLLS